METSVKNTSQPSPRSIARIAGAFDLLEALMSGFGQVIVPGALVVAGNAAVTAANVLTHASLFQWSVALGVVGAVCHIGWTLLFYLLFKPVNRGVALLAAFVSLVAISVQVASSVLQLSAFVVLRNEPPLAGFTGEQVNAVALMVLQLTTRTFQIYLVFFGFWCVLTGYLIFESTFLPRVLGVLEALAGLCWLTFLWPPLAHVVSPYNQLVAALGELLLMFWLLFVGVDSARWYDKAQRRSLAGESKTTS